VRPRFPALVLSAAVVPAVIALPVLPLHHAPRPHPVRALSHSLDVAAAQSPATTNRFSLIGASWKAGALTGAQVEVRVRQHGHWSTWSALTQGDSGPDSNSPDARRAAGRIASEPLWVGPADGVQARIAGVSAARAAQLVSGVRLSLVDPGTSDADASVGSSSVSSTAMAATLQPAVYTRHQWGADESLRLRACPEGPDYSNTVKVGFVHHTDTSNSYSASDVPAIIRSIYAYHVNSNGWCDIGYNFLVDRFGRIWEGRYGGMNRAVVGAHTGGFNKDSFGAAAIGTFTSVQPPAAVLSAYEHLFAWKLGLYFRDPLTTDKLVSAGGGTDKWPTGQTVTFNRISGHRDAGSTTCPGDALYAKLSTIRSVTRALMGTSVPYPAGDFDGNLATEPATYDPATGTWHIGALSAALRYGNVGDIPVPGSYVSAGKTSPAVWRPSEGNWYVYASGQAPRRWGLPGDIPVPADYNGDGITDRAVWRPSDGTWWVDLPGFGHITYGTKGDIPVPADYTGDGRADRAVFRPSTATWYVFGVGGLAYGSPGDVPVPGDYDGDGRVDRTVWRPSSGAWYAYGPGTVAMWGLTGDVPAPGDFFGSSIASPSVYRPSDGTWWTKYSSAHPALGGEGYEPLVLPYAIYQSLVSAAQK
jgi:hypothetical protein